MRLYVASAFGNIPEVRSVQQALRAAGHEVTWDWTTENASHLTPHSPAWRNFLMQCGDADLRGVLTADAVVVVAHVDMRDTRAEMGIALGAGIPVFVLYPERAFSVFYGHTTGVRSVSALLRALKKAPSSLRGLGSA